MINKLRLLLTTALLLTIPFNGQAQQRLYADVNNDGEVNIADINAVIDVILGGQSQQQFDYVDLGLPSGTLWATKNIGASKPEDYGDYFAWGETSPKDYFDYNTYKWCNGSDDTMTKYCTNGSYGTIDDKIELDPEDDAAYVNWGSSWRMPTLEQQRELVTDCTWTWTMQNGVSGYLLTGPNGNKLFLPAAGFRIYESLDGAVKFGYYWSRTLNPEVSCLAYYLYFYSGSVYLGNSDRRSGRCIRAVRVPQN